MEYILSLLHRHVSAQRPNTHVHTHAQMYMHKCRCSQRNLINSSSIIYQGEVSWVMSQVAAAFSAALTSLLHPSTATL